VEGVLEKVCKDDELFRNRKRNRKRALTFSPTKIKSPSFGMNKKEVYSHRTQGPDNNGVPRHRNWVPGLFYFIL
jgi:hypothetical protein